NFLFIEAAELNGGLFDAVLPIILSIGRAEVNLYGVLCIYVAGVGHIDGNFERLAVCGGLNAEIAVFKVGIGDAVAEGKCHFFSIVEISGIAVAEYVIFIPRFVIAIAYIYAFL